MPVTHPTPPTRPVKPSKPYPDFPLFPHATKRWAKKIRGQMVYFGPWDDPDGALEKYLSEKDDLHAGRTPRAAPEALTVKGLCNLFLAAKQALVDEGQLSPLTWIDYKTATDEAVTAFGKQRLVSDLRAEDFSVLRKQMAKKWGLQRLCKTIQFVRCVFRYAYEAELIDRPIRFGPDFKRPSKKTFRIDRAKKGPKLFTSEEIRKLLNTASAHLKAMILLGINSGLGNSDCGRLPQGALDLDKGTLDFARPKTGIPRRCVLWPETIAALRESLALRPVPKKEEHAGLVFLTSRGDTWDKADVSGPITRQFAKLLRQLGINGRAGLGFYTLRHTFRTIADEAKDQPAADYIMGHESSHMSTVYRERISDERLRAVTDHVRGWLFPSPKE
jgi:integrase